jgi:hypothetical protein
MLLDMRTDLWTRDQYVKARAWKGGKAAFFLHLVKGERWSSAVGVNTNNGGTNKKAGRP